MGNPKVIGRFVVVVSLAIGIVLVGCSPKAEEPVKGLQGAHAHNDYEHKRPLLDALAHGFQSVEADVFLVDGKLLVAHNLEDVKANRTLQGLYLDPLLKRVNANQGWVHKDQQLPFYLMIDFKSEAESAYAALKVVLENYRSILTQFSPDQTVRGPVTIVISGNRPFNTLPFEATRLAGIDGRLVDLEGSLNVHLIPWVSERWGNHFEWSGEGPLSESEGAKLNQLVALARTCGVKLRFWKIPDHSVGWGVIRDAGVDLLNTDDLAGLQSFLLNADNSGPVTSR